MCTLGDFDSIELDDVHRSLVQTELEMWHEQYLPCGKKILDIGAGCGETALFYLKHGAEKVVCVEGDPEALRILHRNFDNEPRVIIVPLMLDHIKIDVDGAEEGMLIETHFPAPVFEPVWRDGTTDTVLRRLTRLPKLTP